MLYASAGRKDGGQVTIGIVDLQLSVAEPANLRAGAGCYAIGVLLSTEVNLNLFRSMSTLQSATNREPLTGSAHPEHVTVVVLVESAVVDQLDQPRSRVCVVGERVLYALRCLFPLHLLLNNFIDAIQLKQVSTMSAFSFASVTLVSDSVTVECSSLRGE